MTRTHLRPEKAALKPGTTTAVSYIARVPISHSKQAEALGGTRDSSLPCGWRFDSRAAYEAIRKAITSSYEQVAA
ncbi:hypothetical protein FRIGORI9N_400130 [Frigoribacterium sp. 9N]|nr:hypothetical protein FRIGORI9N_400130 [Frigoribacterium sp. 9N]